ncbi:hypothetical protein CAEBREN_11463 [Caenorhabditis brenneri]|uniref:Uncharacterized protein n=1 Tax=Caenorhabditis brenneri TaxID=135651 RepID=G0NGF0_CAEBE|nr:hypothetical protein CAEBREN_11463 [Caenorhabditis brenneri]
MDSCSVHDELSLFFLMEASSKNPNCYLVCLNLFRLKLFLIFRKDIFSDCSTEGKRRESMEKGDGMGE